MLGLLAGAWGAHIPSVKTLYGLDDAGVAGVLLTGAVGALLSLLLAGRVVGRLGTRRVSALAGAGMAGLLAAVLLWPGLAWLLPAMLLWGCLSSLFDVAINAEGTTLEAHSGRAVMGQLHGMFSLGGMAGAAAVAALLRLGWPAPLQMLVLASLALVVVLLASRGMLPASAHTLGTEPADTDASTAHFTWPRGRLLLIGLLIFAGMTAEGVMYDWSVLYLQDALQQPQERAALGYAVFSAAMAATRLGGDALRNRYPAMRLLRLGAALSGGAMAAVLLLGQPALALLGYAAVGAGLALVVPILFQAASQVPGSSRAAAIAAVSSIGYAGFLVGPPLIGALAQWASLPVAMAVVVLASAALAWGARRL